MENSELNKNIEKNMSHLREARGLSRKELAERASLFDVSFSETAIRRVEDGSRPMRADELAAVCEIFRVEPRDFMYNDMTDGNSVTNAAYDLKEKEKAFERAISEFQECAQEVLRTHAYLKDSLLSYSQIAGLTVNKDQQKQLSAKAKSNVYRLDDYDLNVIPNKEALRILELLQKDLTFVRLASAVKSGKEDTGDMVLRAMGGGK